MLSRIASSVLLVATLMPATGFPQALPLERIRLPPGFTIELVARVPGAREMTFGANGTLFAGSIYGDVRATTFDTRDVQAWHATVRLFASGPIQPVGVAF